MFDSLTTRLKDSFKKLSGGGTLTEAHVDEAMKDIRRSLLEADVHFKVAKEICEQVRQKAIGLEVWKKLSPGQQVVQLFHEELVTALGGAHDEKLAKTLEFSGLPPVVVLVMGLQGSGKTTFTAKLALHLKKKLKKSVGILPADCARPAAKLQLMTLAKKIEVPAFDSPLEKGAVAVAAEGLAWAKKEFFDVLIVDTAGRQQVDDELMVELEQVKGALNPQERILVLDSMIGSQGLDVAKAFHQRAGVTGLVLSKLDGDARGGVALSARAVTGVPIYFASLGEKTEDLEIFHPDRMAQRVLGMGDVLTLIEKAREVVTEEDAAEQAQKMMSGAFTLEDFLNQMKTLQSMGPLEGLMKMIPGMGDAMSQLPKGIDPQKEMKRTEAMIQSMTPQERRNPDILNGRRRLRIAQGSGTQVADLNRFLKQFQQTQKMMKQFGKLGAMGKMKNLASLMKPR
jgi:signal recognition particle subunit SRP54